MSNNRQVAVTLAFAAVALWFVCWFDHSIVQDAVYRAGYTYDTQSLMNVELLATFVTAGAALLVAWLGWRLSSPIVSAVYVAAGSLFASLSWTWLNLAGSINGAAPILPDPFGRGLIELHTAAEGPLRAVEMVGAAMLIAGVASLVRSVRASASTAKPIPDRA